MPDAEEPLKQVQMLLERFDEMRARLAAKEDPEAGMEVMTELAEIARQLEAAIVEAKRDADADA